MGWLYAFGGGGSGAVEIERGAISRAGSATVDEGALGMETVRSPAIETTLQFAIKPQCMASTGEWCCTGAWCAGFPCESPESPLCGTAAASRVACSQSTPDRSAPDCNSKKADRMAVANRIFYSMRLPLCTEVPLRRL